MAHSLSLPLLGFTILLQSFTFLSLKLAADLEGGMVPALIALAFAFLGARAFFWQRLLQRTDITVAYPFAALVQVLILGYAVFLFGESVSLNNIIGVCLMLCGVYLLSR